VLCHDYTKFLIRKTQLSLKRSVTTKAEQLPRWPRVVAYATSYISEQYILSRSQRV